MGLTLLYCPFCGQELDADDDDVLHRSGTGWVDDKELGTRYYVNSLREPCDGFCYEVHCPSHYGGCGASIGGDSEMEAVNKWNTRIFNKGGRK